jgi:hypothetical protein
MIKSTYKKRKRRDTFGKKALTVGGIVTAGIIEAKTGYKVSGAIGKGADKAFSALGTAGKNIKTFGGNVKKSFMDAYNPPEPKKIPKSRRLTAGRGPELDKTKLLGPGKGKPKGPTTTIHLGKGDFGVVKEATKKTRNRPKAKPVLHGSISDPLGTKGQTIGGKPFDVTKKQVLNTTGLPKGPGTTAGSFKPKLTLDDKLMSDYKSIAKTKASAKKRQANLIKNAPGKAMQPGDTVGARSKARDAVAKKVRASRKRVSNKVTQIGKSIDARAKQISKTTGRTIEKVKAFNKRLSTPAGKAALKTAYKTAAKRAGATAVALAPVPGARVASVAMHTAITASTAKDVVNIAKAVKSSSGKKKSKSKTKRVKF